MAQSRLPRAFTRGRGAPLIKHATAAFQLGVKLSFRDDVQVARRDEFGRDPGPVRRAKHFIGFQFVECRDTVPRA
jgi:hypothetical protein